MKKRDDGFRTKTANDIGFRYVGLFCLMKNRKELTKSAILWAWKDER